jgi:hypothetical protein
MGQAVIRVDGLPASPLAAAAAFHAGPLGQARKALAEADGLALVFVPAGHEHRGWRLAAVQEFAREAAPKRVNALAGSDEAAIMQVLEFFATSPGITGQLLSV